MSTLSVLKSILSPVSEKAPSSVPPTQEALNVDLGVMDPKWWTATSEERASHNALVKKMWKEYVSTHQPTSSQMFVRNLLLGRDPKKGFTPITNDLRLRSGHHPYLGWHQAKTNAIFSKQSWEWCSSAPTLKEVFVTDENHKRWTTLLGKMQ